ncbi:MAG: hypothetical protein Q9218_000440 [Villophora microphyllina]
MPVLDSPAILCARFLKANQYNDTLQAFLTEADLSHEVIDSGDLTIETILEEKRVFDLSLKFEKSDISHDGRGWNEKVSD